MMTCAHTRAALGHCVHTASNETVLGMVMRQARKGYNRVMRKPREGYRVARRGLDFVWRGLLYKQRHAVAADSILPVSVDQGRHEPVPHGLLPAVQRIVVTLGTLPTRDCTAAVASLLRQTRVPDAIYVAAPVYSAWTQQPARIPPRLRAVGGERLRVLQPSLDRGPAEKYLGTLASETSNATIVIVVDDDWIYPSHFVHSISGALLAREARGAATSRQAPSVARSDSIRSATSEQLIQQPRRQRARAVAVGGSGVRLPHNLMTFDRAKPGVECRHQLRATPRTCSASCAEEFGRCISVGKSSYAACREQVETGKHPLLNARFGCVPGCTDTPSMSKLGGPSLTRRRNNDAADARTAVFGSALPPGCHKRVDSLQGFGGIAFRRASVNLPALSLLVERAPHFLRYSADDCKTARGVERRRRHCYPHRVTPPERALDRDARHPRRSQLSWCAVECRLAVILSTHFEIHGVSRWLVDLPIPALQEHEASRNALDAPLLCEVGARNDPATGQPRSLPRMLTHFQLSLRWLQQNLSAWPRLDTTSLRHVGEGCLSPRLLSHVVGKPVVRRARSRGRGDSWFKSHVL
jgi:hypothetical protein